MCIRDSACWLLGIRSEGVLALHPLRGALFENWVVSEFIKARYNQGQPSDLYFWRDNNGLEADLIFEQDNRLQMVEIKSGQTITSDTIRAGQRAIRGGIQAIADYYQFTPPTL